MKKFKLQQTELFVMENPEVGQTIEVTIEQEVYKPRGIETKQTTETGEIVNVPSSKFNWESDTFDFDYQLELSTGESGTVRSVDLDAGKVCQLHYDAGGDRDWDTFELINIETL
jgi:hypothetical protein